MDSVDTKILKMLSADARKPLCEMGKEVGLSTSGVRRRIKRLERLGVIKGYSAVLNPKKLGLGLVAFVSINVDSRNVRDLVRSLSRCREVCELYRTTGSHSLMVKVRANDLESLNAFVERRINSFDFVKNVHTVAAMETWKDTGVSP